MEEGADPQDAEQFDYVAEEAIFRRTFEALRKSLGDMAFAIAYKTRDKLTAGFGAYHFEAITIGLQAIIDPLDLEDQDSMRRLSETLMAIKLDPIFIDLTTGGGKNSPGPLNARIQFVQDRLVDAFPR
jgi:hypothetical protein